MPIRRLLAGSKLGPDEIDVLNRALDQALRSLGVPDRNTPDPLIEMLARKIIEIGATTVRDPAKIAKLAIEELRLPASSFPDHTRLN
jgi:hypothetical protein